MIIKLFLILVFQTGNTPEQAALDYFMTYIFPTEASLKARLKFNGETERSGTYFSIVSPCFKDYDSDKEINFELHGSKPINADPLKLNTSIWKKSLKKFGENEMLIY